MMFAKRAHETTKVGRPVVCPTVTAYEPHEYREQLERLLPFARRIHFDFMDGDFAPTVSPRLEQAWWPDDVAADVHVMFRRPAEQLAILCQLRPSLVVVHAEADGDFAALADTLHAQGIGVGLALLPATEVKSITGALDYLDHVLVFSGDLGHHGGHADLSLLGKVTELKILRPQLEVSWDGGINADNAAALVRAGVDVLNVGGYIQKSANPQDAYRMLTNICGGS